MHNKSSSLSTKNDHHRNFIWKHSGELAKNDPQELGKQSPPPPIEAPPELYDFGNIFNTNKQKLRKIYNETFHWKKILFTISKNKVGFKNADVMNAILAKTLEVGPQTSITKTLPKRLDLWIRCEIDDLFVDATALQEQLKKINRQREVGELKAFDKHMESAKIWNALWCLSGDAKGGVLSTSDRVVMRGKNCIAINILQEKQPCRQKADLKNIATNLNCCFMLLFLKKNGFELKRAARKTNGSHGQSCFDAEDWRNFFTSHKSSSIDFCKTVSKTAIGKAKEELNFLITLVVWVHWINALGFDLLALARSYDEVLLGV